MAIDALEWSRKIRRPIFAVYRKVAAGDFVVSISLFALSALASAIGILLYFAPALGFTEISSAQYSLMGIIVFSLGLLAGVSGVSYTLRLRTIGITGADAEIESGIDYKAAIKKVDKGFDFLGIGASKLTADETAFEEAVGRMSRKQQPVRMLLCDPRSPALGHLETLAGVGAGKFKTNVKRSFTLLHQVQKRFPRYLLIRLYNPATEDDLPPFRLMFLNQTTCLVSQNVLGAQREGRALPQLHINSDRVFESDPTFYLSYQRLFEQMWKGSTPVQSGHLQKIASEIDLS